MTDGTLYYQKVKAMLLQKGIQAKQFGLTMRLQVIREVWRETNSLAGNSNWNKNHECDPFCEICQKHPDEEVYRAEV